MLLPGDGYARETMSAAPQTFSERVAAAKQRISEVSVGEAHTLQAGGALLIDVREALEHQDGIARGAIPSLVEMAVAMVSEP